MLTEQSKKVFEDLKLPYSPIAVKFCRNKPEGFDRVDDVDMFCAFPKKAQDENRAFYITVDNDKCMGKCLLGMKEFPGGHASGQVGHKLGSFRSDAANARLYHMVDILKPGTCNFVVFSPVSLCDFDPDIVFCVAPTEEALLLLRASSYISGDLWESKSSFVMSCAWTYTYPYISGKVNHLFTGMHLGMKIRGFYPPGLHIISIPYQKLDEVVTALTEMDWVLTGLRQDDEGKALNDSIRNNLAHLDEDINNPTKP